LLDDHGVYIPEQDKALMCQVFSLEHAYDKLDYLKLDQAFEGEQQALYAQEALHTHQWERRVFRKLGDFLRKSNKTVEECFDVLDDSRKGTIPVDKFVSTLIEFGLGLTERQLQTFARRVANEEVDEEETEGSNKDDLRKKYGGQSKKKEKKQYVSKEAFVRRFWAAYTYDEVAQKAEDQRAKAAASIASAAVMPEGAQRGDRGRIASGLQTKLKALRIYQAIQERVRARMTPSDSYNELDVAKVGFITQKDVQNGLAKTFSISLRHEELVSFFGELDRDGRAQISYQEWELFCREDYANRVRELETEKERMVTQYDIFDHLLKVLKQKGLTLEEMFEQIDLDKNGFIEVDEFHQVLEVMGFMITEEQVFELMRQMDDNFDGRISFAEIKKHILRLGFKLDRTLESRQDG
jgi:Ca2+-binding EF-hand superfamily protein